jgi:hypothetical protein
MISGIEQLLLHATAFYKELFGPGKGNTLHSDTGLWSDEDKLTSQENSELTKPFQEDEIKQALFLMERNKAA